ncbi:MAG: cob(I)yrinic acid a,c-diamide adenosyltransferase [Phycisphaerales bacterium]|nr:cob(I)yrinic acid a,c-diamide adenosyltransferase [Phycisphaerales bacterium]
MKLYTRTGDAGQTSLFGGRRTSKDDARVAAYGDVDETNAAIGLAATGAAELLASLLRQLQSDLFVLGSELADPDLEGKSPRLGAADVERLERWIDEACASVAPMRQFILPGGSELASRLHLARTISRRAERAVVTLNADTPLGGHSLVYLNRLSDLLFALARQANAAAGVPDVPWKPT